MKPYLLQIRERQGQEALDAFWRSLALPGHLFDDETDWVSLGTTLKVLEQVAVSLGDEALLSRGKWATAPEVLGAYVHILRGASSPEGAYNYLAENSTQLTRIGQYSIVHIDKNSATIRYSPTPETSAAQKNIHLRRARVAELRAIPRLWGLGDANILSSELSQDNVGEEQYELSWQPPSKKYQLPMAMAAGALVGGVPWVFVEPWYAPVLGTLVGAGLGAGAAQLQKRVNSFKSKRKFEAYKISALERSLELRGLSQSSLSEGLIGSILSGKYRVLKRIGSGGIGDVYAAEHIALASPVAIKVLKGAAALDSAEIARLRREAQVQVSIEHPNVVRTLDMDQLADGSLYVVMERLIGHTLDQLLRRKLRIHADEAIPWFIQVCGGLAAAHELGVVHRDLKPGNIFICEDTTVKVLDFGMSKLSQAETLTEEGYTLGTPEYMAPEQCLGKAVGPRTDIYSLGVLMYEAFTGELPFQTRNRRQLLKLHQFARPVSMRAREPAGDLSEALDQLVLSCLAKAPEDRPSSAAELARELERCLTY